MHSQSSQLFIIWNNKYTIYIKRQRIKWVELTINKTWYVSTKITAYLKSWWMYVLFWATSYHHSSDCDSDCAYHYQEHGPHTRTPSTKISALMLRSGIIIQIQMLRDLFELITFWTSSVEVTICCRTTISAMRETILFSLPSSSNI